MHGVLLDRYVFSVNLHNLCAPVVVILSLLKDYHRETEGTREAQSRPIETKSPRAFLVQPKSQDF
jgi:hypothetical protein